jgi:hypothetical protein
MTKATRGAVILMGAFAAFAGSLAAGRSSTFDAQLYGRWIAKTSTTTGSAGKKVVATRSVMLQFSANNNLYYEARTTVNGKDTEKSISSGVYQVVIRGTLRVSLDPTLNGVPYVWEYQVAGGRMVIVDENGAPQTFTKVVDSA